MSMASGAAHRLWSLMVILCLTLTVLGTSGANPPGRGTVLGIDGTRFTLNRRATFLLGCSYYGALGAPREFIQKDLRDLREGGFNWVRVWATWGGYGTNVSAVTAGGLAREPFFGRLLWLVEECDRLGMVADVTLNRGKELGGFPGHLDAVKAVVEGLKGHRNWYLDLGNERDVGDERHVSLAELKELRARVRLLDPERLVTASFGGHDLSREDVMGVVKVAGVDFLCPHRPRHAKSPTETEAETRRTLVLTAEAGRRMPVHYQEPFRRGYTAWEPAADDFLKDLGGALRGGAAGWCFHNGGQRATPEEQPRRSFDMRGRRLMDQLDPEEMKVIRGVKAILSGSGD